MSKRLLGLRRKLKIDTVEPDIVTSINNLPNLPPELWLEIFAHAASPTGSIYTELQDTRSTHDALWHDLSVLIDPYVFHYQPSLMTRYSIILVCKAWYQIGISALYSHVLIDMGSRREKLESLSHSVKKYPALTSSVIRLSITTVDKWSSIRQLDESKYQLLAELFDLLINVRIFTLPFSILRDFSPTLRPEVIMIFQEETRYQDRSSLDVRASLELASQVHTLSFQNRGSTRSGFFADSTTISLPLLFPNLVNLKLELRFEDTSEWVLNSWVLPQLRTLSIACYSYDHLIRLVRRHANNLTALEITMLPGYENGHYSRHRSVPQVDPVQLPSLIKLCLFSIYLQHRQEPIPTFLDLLIAPRLTQLCYQLPYISGWFRDEFFTPRYGSPYDRYYLRGLGDKAREMWPTIRELTFSYWIGWMYLWREDVHKSDEEIKMEKEKLKEVRARFGWARDVNNWMIVFHEDTEEDRIDCIKWLVEEWVEDDITVILKHRQITELVFPRKTEGDMSAMRKYRNAKWSYDRMDGIPANRLSPITLF